MSHPGCFNSRANTCTLVVMGAPGVGRSALILRLIYGSFFAKYVSSITDTFQQGVTVDGIETDLDILDTSTRVYYGPYFDIYFRGGDAFLLVYDCTSRRSFDSINSFRESIVDEKSKSMVLVGNKSDVTVERQVDTVEGIELAAAIGCPFVETSSLDNVNVHEIFYDLIREVRNKKETARNALMVESSRKAETQPNGSCGVM